MTIGERELRPAMTPQEAREADAVLRHAEARAAVHGALSARKRALVVVRCNQLAGDNRAQCDWARNIESTTANAERDGRRAIAAHLRTAHPYLTGQGVRSIVGNAWINLRDVTGGR